MIVLSLFSSLVDAQMLVGQKWESFYSHQDSIFNISTDLDANGSIYVTGYVNNLTEGRNILTLMYDSTGILNWANEYHYSSDDRGFKNVCDAYGNVYTYGKISNGITSTLVLIKYDVNGNELWDFLFAPGLTNEPTDILLGSNGNIILLANSILAGQSDVFVSLIDPDGNLVNSYQYDDGANDFSVNIANSNGKIMIAVNEDNGISLNGRVLQFDDNLSLDWIREFNFDLVSEIRAVRYDQAEDIVVLYNENQIENRAVLYKLTSTNDSIWTRKLDDGNTYQTAKCLSIDSGNNIITTYVHNGASEVSVHLVNENGILQWNKYYYSSGLDFKNFAAISDGSRIVVAGSEANLTSSNMVVFTLDYDGVLGWQHHENGNGGISEGAYVLKCIGIKSNYQTSVIIL